jgi:energy-coupling factor transport system ATP-binding protein
VEDALELTALGQEKDTNPYDLSPTWRKMVAMASVIAMDTPVVVFDEPTTGQDAVAVHRIARLIRVLHERGKTIITITHDIDFCAENFNRIIVMAGGKVLLDGPKHDVIAQEEVLAQTWVQPPQLTRLAKRLGMVEVPGDQAEFLRLFAGWLQER